MPVEDKPLKVALVDDNFAVRMGLKILTASVFDKLNIKASYFSAQDGVEGIGYILVASPELIVVDTTLPKYSGRDLIEYLTTNQKFFQKHVTVIVISDGNEKDKHLPFKVINKNHGDFTDRYYKMLLNFAAKHKRSYNLQTKDIMFSIANSQRAISTATAIEKVRRKQAKSYFIPFKFVWSLAGLYLRFSNNFNLLLLLLFGTVPQEENKQQESSDKVRINLTTYPMTIVSLIVGIGLLLYVIYASIS